MPRNTHATAALSRRLLIAILATGLAGTPASAQYFGRNKVVYHDFDFRVLRTPNYDVHFYPSEALATRDAARMAERWYARLVPLFQDSVDRRSLILYASPAHFHQTNVVPSQLGEGTGGVTEGYRSRVTMPLTGLYAETDHVLGHELVHVFQYAAAQGPAVGGIQRMAALPLWLVEGMAEYLSVGREDAHTAMWMRAAVRNDEVPGFGDLTDPSIFPYRYGQSLCAYIGGRWGDATLISLYQTALQRPLSAAITEVLGVAPEELAAQWRAAMRDQYLPLMAGRTAPAEAGRPVLADQPDEPGLDVGPVVSPDGRSVAFFSSRSLFAVDLYIADVASGDIVTRLTSPTGSEHFDALSFLYTAGTWSPDSRQFAFVTYDDGQNALAIVDVGSGDIVRQVDVVGIDAIESPTWSPDGNRIAFTGQYGGITDLYVHDLPTNHTRRLTNDRFADLQPAWSPDGRSIAFVTDRGRGTDFGSLQFAKLGLATLDVPSNRVNTVSPPLFANVDVLNPRWSPDASSLFVLAAPDGFRDIYRVDLPGGQVSRVTRVATGVSGITSRSPALSVAARTGDLFFSVFDRTGYRMLTLDAAAARGEPVNVASQPAAALLPPATAVSTSIVERMIHDPTLGRMNAASYEVRPYSASLRLDAVAPVTLGVGSSVYGTGLVGGLGANWSDELGNRNLGVAVQSLGDFRDVGAQVSYVDLGNRWQRGATLARIPYLSTFSTIEEGDIQVDGQTRSATLVNQFIQRIYFDQFQAGTAYPFSPVQRFELGVGATRVTFDRDVRRLAFIGNTGFDLGTEDAAAPDGISFVQGSAALVFDNSIFGFTSPIAGGRYRLEAAPAVGGLTFTTVTADYRRYFLARPFTFAMRGLAYGRFGRDAESDEFSPLYLGDGALVRGYSVYSFDPAECGEAANGGNTCPEFDRLLGSRIGVFNVEMRVPLLGTPDFGLFSTRLFPVELAPFVDAGVAWTSSSSPEFVFERNTAERVPIVSAGVASRINLFGAIVVEIYGARPFQRPAKNWVWGFQLLPGW